MRLVATTALFQWHIFQFRKQLTYAVHIKKDDGSLQYYFAIRYFSVEMLLGYAHYEFFTDLLNSFSFAGEYCKHHCEAYHGV